MNDNEMKGRLLALTAVSTQFCNTLQNVAESTKTDFVNTMLSLLPRIYWQFFDLSISNPDDSSEYMIQEFVDEDYYESIRRHIETLLGADDTYLETFEEDMKYSDTPISASVAEGLADIFQPLYNFISAVRESDGDLLVDAFSLCKEDFASYWAQTLCNVMRALNSIRFSPDFGQEDQ